MLSRTDDILGSLAVERGFITAAQLEEVRQARLREDRPLGELLLVRGLLSPAQLGRLTEDAVERATRTVTPRTRTPQVAADNPATARAVEDLASDQKYEVRDQIAQGGMGRILRAYDRRLRRHVAMKVIRTEHGLTADDLARFIDEAQATAQLEHPNIVPTHEIGLDADGNLFFTMRLVKGRSLREIIDKLITGDPATLAEFTLTRLLQTLQQICYALAYAHAKGVIHRDLKPENIMLGEFGEVLVMDWGLAKVFGQADRGGHAVRTLRSDADSSRTLDGMVAGTPAYMSPEQARGDIADVDQQSDVFGAGAILYEMLTHRKPIAGQTTTDILLNAADGKFTPVDDAMKGRPMSKEVLAICRKAMAFKKPDRYPNARALADDVQAFFEGRRGAAWSDTPLSLAWKWAVRHKALSSVAAAAVLAFAALSGWFYTRPGGASIETDPVGAELLLDGRPIGTSPAALDGLAAGGHDLRMRLKDHEDQDQRIDVGRGSTTRYRFVLKSVKAHFQFATDPVAAMLVVTDRAGAVVDRKTSPGVFTLIKGDYTLTAYAPGYARVALPIRSDGGGEYRQQTLTLVEDKARLDVAVFPRDAVCTVTDVQTGVEVHRAPVPEGGLRVPAAPIRVRFELASHFPQEFALSPSRDEVVRLAASLSPMQWWRTARDGRPALADVDGDGRPEIAIVALDVRVIDGSGNTVWSAPLDEPAILAPAVVDVGADGRADLVIATPTSLVAFAGATGKRLWSQPSSLATRILGIDGVVAVVSQAELTVHDAATGRELWSADVDPSRPVTRSGGRLVVHRGGRLELYEAVTGRETSLRLEEPEALRSSPPALTDLDGDGAEDVLVAYDLDERGSELRAFRLADGSVLWRRALEGRAGVPVVAGRRIWIGTESRLLFAVASRDGRIESRIALRAAPIGAPALGRLDDDDEPDVVIGDDRGFVAYSGASGAVLSTFTTTEGATGAVALADLDADGAPEVALLTRSGHLTAVHVLRSPWLWRQQAFASAIAPAVAGREAIVPWGEREIGVVDLATGRVARAGLPDEIGRLRLAAAVDIERDGTAEWLALDERGSLALGNATGIRWVKREFYRGIPVRAFGTRDANGDSAADVLVVWSHRVSLFSGRDGTHLWSRDVAGAESAEAGADDVVVLGAEELVRLALAGGKPLAAHRVSAHLPNASIVAPQGPRFLAYLVTNENRLVGVDGDGREVVIAEQLRSWSLRVIATADGPGVLASPMGRPPVLVLVNGGRRMEMRDGAILAGAAAAGSEIALGTTKGLCILVSPALEVRRSFRVADDGPVHVAPFDGGVLVLGSRTGLLGALRAPSPRRADHWGFDGSCTRDRVFDVR